MRRWRRLITILITMMPVVLAAATAALAGAPDPRVARRVMTLTRATHWTRVAAIPLRFRTFHPQGMVRIGDEFFVSSVEIRTVPKKLAQPRDGHPYDAGVGIGHLFKVGADGALLADLTLGEGSIYHPGGIDGDGRSIWVPVAEYRPDSRAIVYRVDPRTMTAVAALRVADHVGGVALDEAGHRLIGLTWGSRRLLTWPIASDGSVGPPAASSANPESYVDYQDCHGAGGRLMVCTGVAEYQVAADAPPFPLGGLDLVDLATGRPAWQTPIALWAPSGRAMTQNPFWIEATATGLRAWFLPDDDTSTLFVYDTVTPTSADAAAPTASRAPTAPPADTASPRRRSGP